MYKKLSGIKSIYLPHDGKIKKAVVQQKIVMP